MKPRKSDGIIGYGGSTVKPDVVVNARLRTAAADVSHTHDLLTQAFGLKVDRE